MKKNKAKVQESQDEFLTVRELANWIKLSESHVYFMVNKNKIPFAKLGGKLLFERNAIRKWIDANSSKPVVKKKTKKKPVKVNLPTPVEVAVDVEPAQPAEQSAELPVEQPSITELTPVTE